MDLHVSNLSSSPPELFQHGLLPAAPDAPVCPATSIPASQDGPVVVITESQQCSAELRLCSEALLIMVVRGQG